LITKAKAVANIGRNLKISFSKNGYAILQH